MHARYHEESLALGPNQQINNQIITTQFVNQKITKSGYSEFQLHQICSRF